MGGSDSHNLINERYEGADLPSVAGDPGTWVCCGDLTPNNLMAAVKAGHMCVTRFCKMTPVIQAAGKNFLPGDELPEEADKVTIRALVQGLSEKPEISLVVNGDFRELEVKEPEDKMYEATAEIDLEEKGWQWMRLEIRSRKQELLGYMNPVFKGHKDSVYRTFGEIKKIMDES